MKTQIKYLGHNKSSWSIDRDDHVIGGKREIVNWFFTRNGGQMRIEKVSRWCYKAYYRLSAKNPERCINLMSPTIEPAKEEFIECLFNIARKDNDLRIVEVKDEIQRLRNYQERYGSKPIDQAFVEYLTKALNA